MLVANVSGVQVATLIVAAIAVVAGFVGPYFVARFSSKTEHNVWQRGIRVRMYGDLMAAGQDFLNLLTRVPRPDGEDRMVAFHALWPRVVDVDTYGSLEVSKAALKLFKESAVLIIEDSWDATEVREAVSAYRKTVRKSLKISDN